MPINEMLEIEAFDEDTVNELRSRARNALLTEAIVREETVEQRRRGPAEPRGHGQRDARRARREGHHDTRRACRPRGRRAGRDDRHAGGTRAGPDHEGARPLVRKHGTRRVRPGRRARQEKNTWPRPTVDTIRDRAQDARRHPARAARRRGRAGKKQGDKLTEQDKTRLLDYLRKQHGGLDQKKKITLTRKQTTEIKAADSTGKRAHDPGRGAQEARVRQARRRRRGSGDRGGRAGRAAAGRHRGRARSARGRSAQGCGADRQAAGRDTAKAGTGEEAQDQEGKGRGRGAGEGGRSRSRGRRPRKRRPVARNPRPTAKPDAKAKTEGTLHKPVGQAGREKGQAFAQALGNRVPGRSGAPARAQAARRRHRRRGAAGWKQPKGGKHRHEDGEEARGRRAARWRRSRWSAKSRCRRRSPWPTSPAR